MEIRNRLSFQPRLDEDILEEPETDQLSEENFKNLRVYICTWNVNTKGPNFKIDDLIQFDSSNQPDLCAFGFQEINSKPLQRLLDYFFDDPWTHEITNILSKYNFVRLQSTRLVGNVLNIYVKKSILPFIKCCVSDWVRLGFWGLWGNKGANICTISLGGLNICFVNSHLSAHQDQDKARLIEHAKIMYHKFKFANSLELVYDQNYLFLFGDLNFRVENLDIQRVKELIEVKEYEILKDNDQLKKCINKEKCLSLFQESEINFPPSYKFVHNSDNYDLTKKDRVPSWCDRILFKINRKQDEFKCEPFEYNWIPSLKQSDHRPVYGSFQIRTWNWEKEPFLVIFTDVLANADQNLDISYQVNKSLVTHQNDWIGFYDPAFKGYTDYKTYIWASRIYELENTSNEIQSSKDSDREEEFVSRRVTLEQFYLKSGYYILGYFSHISNNLISLSNVFELKLS